MHNECLSDPPPIFAGMAEMPRGASEAELAQMKLQKAHYRPRAYKVPLGANNPLSKKKTRKEGAVVFPKGVQQWRAVPPLMVLIVTWCLAFLLSCALRLDSLECLTQD